jgi:hypothetical protein
LSTSSSPRRAGEEADARAARTSPRRQICDVAVGHRRCRRRAARNSSADLVEPEVPRGHRLVIDAPFEKLPRPIGLSERGREPVVVEERGRGATSRRGAGSRSSFAQELRTIGDESVEGAAVRGAIRAEDMGEAAVLGARVDEECEPDVGGLEALGAAGGLLSMSAASRAASASTKPWIGSQQRSASGANRPWTEREEAIARRSGGGRTRERVRRDRSRASSSIAETRAGICAR